MQQMFRRRSAARALNHPQKISTLIKIVFGSPLSARKVGR